RARARVHRRTPPAAVGLRGVLALGIYTGAPALSGPAGEVRFSVMMPLFLLALAGVIAWNSLRRSPHLRVRTRTDVRKLIVRGKYEQADIEAFLERLRAELGLPRGYAV